MEPEVDGAFESYHILGLQNISSAVNEMLICKYHVQQSVLDFINYCSLDNRVDAGILCEIFNEWKNKNKEQTNVIFTSKHMGIASTINIKCSRCSKVCRSEVKTTKFANSNMQVKHS